MHSLLTLLSGSDDMPIIATTFANLPSASASTGRIYRVTDLGNALFISTGTIWKPLGGHLVLAASATPQSVTGTISETTLATVAIPAGLMTANGQLRIRTLWSYTNSSNNKILRVRLGGTSGTIFLGPTLTTTAGAQIDTQTRNRNAQNSQVGFNFGGSTGLGTTTGTPTTGSVDTSAAQDLIISGVLANTGETITLESYTIELLIP
jgi:hypothetical protein